MAAKKTKRWTVSVEATVAGFVVVDAVSGDEALEVVDLQIDDSNFGFTDEGLTADLDTFSKFLEKGEVHSASALDAFPFKASRKSTAKKTTTKKATKSGTTKGRTRGKQAAKKKAPVKKTTAKKTTAKKATNPKGTTKKTASAGRRRGGSKS